MNILGIISGTVLMILGIVLIIVGLVQSSNIAIIIFGIYGIICLIVGILILLNLNKENQIEQIKRRR